MGMVRLVKTEGTRRWRQETSRYRHVGLSRAIGEKTTPFKRPPGGPGVEIPPLKAGDADSVPDGETKTPHTMEQLNPCATKRNNSPQ